MYIEKILAKVRGTWIKSNDIIRPFLESLEESELEEIYNLHKDKSPYDFHTELIAHLNKKLYLLYEIDITNSHLDAKKAEIKLILDDVIKYEIYSSYVSILKEKKQLKDLESKINELKSKIKELEDRGVTPPSDWTTQLQEQQSTYDVINTKLQNKIRQAPSNSRAIIKEKKIIDIYSKTKIKEKEIENLIEALKNNGTLFLLDGITMDTEESELYNLFFYINGNIEILSEIYSKYKESSISQEEISNVLKYAMRYGMLNRFDSLRNESEKIDKSKKELDEFFIEFAKDVKREHIIRMCNLTAPSSTLDKLDKYDLYNMYLKMNKPSESNKRKLEDAIKEHEDLEILLSSLLPKEEDKNELQKKLIIIRKEKPNELSQYIYELNPRGSNVSPKSPSDIYTRIIDEYDKITSVQKEKKSVVQKELIKVLQRENIPHIKEIIDRANFHKDVAVGLAKSEQEKEMQRKYTVSCMLKAFSIEYMLKGIDVISNLSLDEVESIYKTVSSYKNSLAEVTTLDEQQQIEETQQIEEIYKDKMSAIVGKLMRKVRENLREDDDNISREEAERLAKSTGHEIDDILKKIITPQIRLLIMQQSISNFADSNIREHGIIPSTDEEISSCFSGNYITMIRDFPTEEEQKSTVAKHQQTYQYNNKAFEDYRYQLKQAGIIDEQMLNGLMASSYMVFQFLMKHPTLAVKLEKNEKISLKATDNLLTETEYNNLLNLANSENSNVDFNESIYYHIFLKEYLKHRTPKFNDDRYKRINRFFKSIKETNIDDVTVIGEKFAEWVKNFDINTLSKEELDEIKIFNPQFIFKHLNYYDKVLFKKCEKAGVNFEYYYKQHGKKVTKILDENATYFNSQSIPLLLLNKSISECEKYIEVFKKVNIKIENVPEYYYNCDPFVLEAAYDRIGSIYCDIKKVIPHDRIKEVTTEFVKESIFEDELFFCSDPRENIYRWQEAQIIEESVENLESKAKETQEIKKGIMLELIEKVKNKKITYENCESNGCTREAYRCALMIIRIAEKNKTSYETYIDENPGQLLELLNVDRLNFCIFTKMSRREKVESDFYSTYEEIARTFDVLQHSTNINANMELLSSEELMESINFLKNKGIVLSKPEYLLYQTPSNLKKIVQICESKNIPFYEEMLCYDIEKINSFTLSDISSYIDGIKANSSPSVEMMYDLIHNEQHQRKLQLITSENIEQIKREEGLDDSNVHRTRQSNRSNSFELPGHSQELSRMTSELEISQTEQPTQKKHETI